MKGWNIFFGIITAVIVIFMTVPGALGLQSLTQWGGMYTDGWCYVDVRYEPVDPSQPLPDDKTGERIQSPTTSIVYSAPMHSVDMCYAWGQSWCGIVKNNPDRRVAFANVFYRNEFPFDNLNLCDAPRIDPPWYYQNYFTE